MFSINAKFWSDDKLFFIKTECILQFKKWAIEPITTFRLKQVGNLLFAYFWRLKILIIFATSISFCPDGEIGRHASFRD
jgi:hypothetical protein